MGDEAPPRSTGRRRGRPLFRPHPLSSLGLPLADADLTLARSLRWSAERYATRPAVVFADQHWTYGELLSDVQRCARAFVAAGVTRGTHVGILAGARPEFVIGTYAVAAAGGVVVLLSTFSTDDELEYLLRHGDASILVATTDIRGHRVLDSLAARHPSLPDSGLPFLERIVPLECWETFLVEGDAVDPELVQQRITDVDPEDDAMLLYTSGSTSAPKGVLHRQCAPVIQGFNMADCMAIGPDDRAWTSFPFFWSAGWVTGVGAPLAVGACAVLQEYFDPPAAASLIERERVTSVRQMAHDEHRLVAANADLGHDLSAVTVGVVTDALGACTSVEHVPSEICAWGMTETLTIASMLPFDAPVQLRRTTMGRPVTGCRVRIREPATGAQLPPGEVGEITVSGLSVMRDYYKSADPPPMDPDGYLRTGDAGTLTAEGYLVYTGRLDRMIKTAGVNVSPVEVEEKLASWGRLSDVAVMGIPHPSLGTAVVLAAVRRDGDPIGEREVKEALRGALASYKVPRAVVFLEPSEVPRTVSNKVDITALVPLVMSRLVETAPDREWSAWLASGCICHGSNPASG